jgi:hypothetical protein
MITFKWTILEVFGNEIINKVHYLITADDGINKVNGQGYHEFSKGLVSKPLAETKESDLIGWLDSDTIQGDVNPIKLNLEEQFKNFEDIPKVDLPWLADTFTME